MGLFNVTLRRSPYDTASPAARTCPAAVVIQYPLPVGVAARSMAGLATGDGATTELAAPKPATWPSARTSQPPAPALCSARPTTGAPTLMAPVGPEMVKVTGVPSAAGCPSAPVTVAVTVWTSPGERPVTSWLTVTPAPAADAAGVMPAASE